MATITLSPDHYYQIDNNIVTTIDPGTKNILSNRVIWAHFTIPSDSWAYSAIISQSIKYYHMTYYQASYITAYANYGTTSINNRDSLELGESVFGVGTFRRLGSVLVNFSGQYADYNTTPSEDVIHNIKGKNLWIQITGGDSTHGFTFTRIELTLNYTEITTPVFKLNPSGGFIDYSNAYTLTLKNANTQNMVNAFELTGGTLNYKLSSASNYTSINFTGNTVTIPSGTLTGANTYDIYADFTTTNNLTNNTTTGTYSTEDAAAVVSIIAPTNTIEYGTVNFSWNYSNTYGSSQYAYDLALSDDNVTFNTVISHEVTAETSTTYRVSTAGAKYWKVRAYNLDDVVGDWSDVGYFVNNIPPEAPTITDISGAGRLTVTWSSTSQIAYEVEVYQGDNKIYDSGEQYTTAKTHLINEYLPNGTYTIKVKILDSFGNSSDYAEQVYTIDNVGSLNVTYTADDTVTLNYDVTGVSKAYILRNGEIIAQTTSGVFNDIYANGTNVYTVITVNADDSYSIGIVETENLVKYTRLVDLEGNIYDISHRFNERIGITRTDQADFDSALFLGSIKPVHTFSKGRVRRYNVTFAYSGDYTEFMAKVVRFMDVYGHSDYVVIPNVSANYRYYGNELSASLEVTDYNAGITYAI